MRRKGITAAELMARLADDPAFQNAKRKRDASLAIVAEACAKDEAQLVAEIRSAGYPVESVYDFVNTADEYPDAIPVLVRHLDLPHIPKIREGIVRALTVAYGGESRQEALLRHFRLERDSHLKWVLANALMMTMPRTQRESIADIETTYRSRAAEPGATDNPDDAQRLREDH